ESGSSFSYKSEMADLSNYAGHVVTLKFELFRVTSGIVPDTAFNLHFDGYSVQAYPTVHIQSTSEMFKSCSDIGDSYTATVTDGGSNPSFQWLVDGISQNTITNNFSGKFAVGQQIECAVISNLPEAGTVPETAYSNIVAVQPSQTGTVKVVSNFYTTVANNIITITANGGNVKCSPFNTAYWLINGQYQAPNPLTGMITPTAYFYAAALKTGDTVQALQFHSGNPCPDLSPVYTIVDNSMYTRMAAQETTSPNPKLTLYPNPAFSNVTIAIDPALAKEAQEIILVNLLGQEVSRRKPDGTTNIILDVSGINNGLYIVMLKTKKETITQKLLIQH
ncbi:MAG: T9SS type A sorting domain-containing protein, partial [Chitinophagaceae bacterium]|nr:T9SS type A sorting domain-containing protein [Chitinophagaceae bacterium]